MVGSTKWRPAMQSDKGSDVEPGVIQENEASPKRDFSETQARAVAAEIGLDLNTAAFDIDMFRRGLNVELEHGRRDPQTNVTNDDPLITGKIAWAHLKELPDYYERLAVLEADAEEPATGNTTA
jgi:hypothetical protein